MPVHILGCLFLILSLTKGTLYSLGRDFSAVLAAEKPRSGGRLRRWGRDGAGGKAFDIDFRWAALALPNTFNQPKTVFPVVQLHQHPGGLVVAAVQILLYLVQRVVDIDAPLLIVPAVLGRQAHAIQQQAI